MAAKDPERQFMGDLCWNGSDGCAGDVRLYDWGPKGYGIVQPVLFTARNGATLSGHIWATKAGPAKRPGIVITNGSVQANEPLYWFAAQALAKAGYVVMTWDPQGQGLSDARGEAPDQDEGFPAQSDGRPFFDGTEDALNFFYSTPDHPYSAGSSCSSGTSHQPKQARRVQAGLNAAYNPYWQRFDHQRVGLAGHSYGAAGVSYIGQFDKRVKAIVAWDNLSQPSPGSGGGQGFPPGEEGCPAHPGDRVDLSKAPAKGAAPALGMSADYFLPPTPNTSEPPSSQHCDAVLAAYEKHGTPPSRDDGTQCKSLASKGYSHRGIDTGEIVIRGGSHLDFSFIPNHAFGASLRGADEIDWYTTAWFDKYVKGDKTADERLLTNRWRHDAREGAVDPDHDSNMMSFYHPSRLDFHLASGKRYDNEDLRKKATGLSDQDGFCGTYSYVAIDTSKDSGNTDFKSCGAAAGCVNSRGGIAGTRLGAARLGRTRKKQRRAIKGKLHSRRGGIDRYCVRGGGALRIGYPTRRLQRSRALRAAVRRRRQQGAARTHLEQELQASRPARGLTPEDAPQAAPSRAPLPRRQEHLVPERRQEEPAVVPAPGRPHPPARDRLEGAHAQPARGEGLPARLAALGPLRDRGLLVALRRRPCALLLLPQLGRELLAEVLRLEHLADLDLALALVGVGAALDPLDRLVQRLHLNQPEAGDQLLGLREGTVDHVAVLAAELDPRALRAGLQPLAREQHARVRQLLVELAHLGEQLLARHDARLGVLVGLDHDHEPHVFSPWL